ncbi:hypothetical protein ACFLW3_00535 [Chloroflexota bacterium]
MRKQIAKLVSIVFSPFVIGLGLILLASLETTASISEAFRWSLILIILSILPILFFTIFLVRKKRLDGILASARKQRTIIYGLTIVLAIITSTILITLKAPLTLIALSVISLTTSIVFMCVNLRWKISLHTAFIGGAVVVLFILYGVRSIVSIVVLPLVAWARMELKQHSPAQVIIGPFAAASIMVVMFYLFGLI